MISGDQDAARYSAADRVDGQPGRAGVYRLRWDLDDIAGILSQIRGPHQQTADTLMTWTGLQKTLEAITR